MTKLTLAMLATTFMTAVELIIFSFGMAAPYHLNRWYFGSFLVLHSLTSSLQVNCNIFGQTAATKFCTYSVRTKACLTKSFNGIYDFLQEGKLTRFNAKKQNVNFKEFH